MKKNLFLILTFAIFISTAQEKTKVDPYHKEDGGFGYLIDNSEDNCAVWWTEGVYKVMKDAPVPEKSGKEIKMWSAKNEYESFIIVVKPVKRMNNFRISVSELKDSAGNEINSENITVRKVEYVNITRPTDSYAFAGWWPDPLPLYEKPETIYPEENQPFWITVKVPEDAKAGDYSGNVTLSSGNWNLSVPVNLHVWDFSLLKTPSVRSGFGFGFNQVIEYENLRTAYDEEQSFDLHMKSFRDYKISPYNPFVLSPIKQEVKGVAWEGGFFDSEIKNSGKYSYRIEDNSATYNAEGSTRDFIKIENNIPYQLEWAARALKNDQEYVVGVECYNAEKKLIVFQNIFEMYKGQPEWEQNKLSLNTFGNETKYIKIRLFPTHRTRSGENTGTVWFDDIKLINEKTNENEFAEGNFEINLDDIDIIIDFEDFNKAGKRYFDEYGFTGYRLSLKGLGGGTFHSRVEGVFEGFKQGTTEYNIMMERYLAQIQNNLEKSGWLGKEYIYWFDEPNDPDYPFVKETNSLIKKYAPKITTFLTEHVADHDISDVTDISCTIWNRLDHDKIKRMSERGLENWSYLCTGPKSPWITLFIDHDAINMRMWLWGSYKHNLKGILVWQTNFWNSTSASPVEYLQNPWEEPMSLVTGYSTPWGKQRYWGNGDGRFFYPLNRDPNNDDKTYIGRPVPSLRLETLRDGIEDYEYFTMLETLINEAKKSKIKIDKQTEELLSIPEYIYTDELTYSKNPQHILEYRKKLAEAIEKIKLTKRK